MLDPFGVSIAIATGNLGPNVACIWFKTFWHRNVVPLVLEVDGEFTDPMTELVAVPCELLDGESGEDFVVVDSGDEPEGNGMDGVIEVVLGCQYCKGCLG